MFYGQYTHIKEILEKIRDEFGFEDVPMDIAMEHTWIALGRLGVKNFLEDYSEEIHIENNRGILPNNMMIVEGIRDKHSHTILVPSKDIYITSDLNTSATGEHYLAGFTVTGTDDVEEITPGVYNNKVTLEPNYAIIESIPGNTPSLDSLSIGYQIKGNYIFCDLSNGTLEIKYKGFPIWDDNTPKIPDDPKVIDFIVNYIGEKIAKKLFIMDKLSRDKYEMIKQDKLFKQGSARNKLLTPDDNDMEFIRRMMVRLIPKPNQFATGFRYLGEQERLK